MRRQWFIASALLALALEGRAHGHGGIDASAFIQDPDRVGVVADQSFTFTWFDQSDVGRATDDTTHDFFFTRDIPRPWQVFAPPADLSGAPIARGIPERDAANQLTWSTATVAAGAYWLWSIADDPDLLTPAASIVFSPYPVVVAHPGDPLHPFVTLRTPDSPASFADGDRFTLEYAVFDPTGTATVTLDRALEDTDAFVPIEQPVPIAAAGELVLDTSSWAEGNWVIRARLEDGQGFSFRAFARFTLLVARLPDAGVPAPDASAPDSALPDASAAADAGAAVGPEPAEGPGEDGCRCAGVGRAKTDDALAAGLLTILIFFAARSRPRRRRPARARSRERSPAP